MTWGIWQILTWALENLKNLHFNGFLLNKVYNGWAKKSIREFCLMALNIDATFERKLTCVFKNDIRNLATFHQSSFKSLKIGTLKKNWLVSSKLTWAIWPILTRALESLKHLHFNGLLLTKVYNWAKRNSEELCLMTLKIVAKFEGKLTCAF